MPWFLHAVELPDGQWACRFGAEELGVTPDETTAVAFLVALAGSRGGRHLFELFRTASTASSNTVRPPTRPPESGRVHRHR